MKKIIGLLVLLLCLSSCTTAENEKKKIKVVTTIFPLYDFCRSVIGDVEGIEVIRLIENAADLHNYQADAKDIVDVKSADLFVYIGGESDEWADAVVSDDQLCINAMEVLNDSLQFETGEAEYDEHVWLSLRNAQLIVEKIAECLAELDESNSEVYRKNAADYCAELKDLDQRYQDVVSQAKRDLLLFGDRFPFLYLTRDYDLKYYAAFSGCSAEAEASFETIRFLAEKVAEYELDSVLCIDGSSHKIAETIIENSGRDCKILVMNSLQSVADDESYLKVMEADLKVLEEALN